VLIVADSKYWLEHPDGSLTELPFPETGPGRSAADRAGAAAAADPAEALTSPHRNGDPDELPETERRSDLLAKLAEQSQQLARAEREAAEHEHARRLAETELARAREAQEQHATAREPTAHPGSAVVERELAALRSGGASLEQELDQSHDQLRIMTFERDELSRQAAAFDDVAVKARERATKSEAENDQLRDTIRELEVWRAELERRLAAMSSELGVARAAREADEREFKRLREALTEAQSRTDGEGRSADASQTLAAQAAEIELLVAELASLRAEQNRPETATPERLTEQASARIARLEAERAELAHRAEQLSAALHEAVAPARALLELARSGLEDRSATAGDSAADAELISRSAEQSPREQAERELRQASHEYSRGGTAAG
jgi:chromosome segregation ATPase